MISSLNSRITVIHNATTQNIVTGRAQSMEVARWDKWASVKQDSGSRTLDNAAISYKKAYTVKMRHETDRPTYSNYQLEYKDQILIIHSVVLEDEGKVWYENLKCYTSE